MAEENAATARKARKLAPRSRVWEHFTRFAGDDGEDRAKCKRCRAELRADTKKSGTSTLWNHVKVCKGQDIGDPVGEPHHPASSPSLPPPPPPPQSQPLLPRPDGGSSEREAGGHEGEDEASRDVARMIALHGYDPSMVEDEHFKSFVHHLNPEFQLPSRAAIEKMCDDIFDEASRGSLLYNWPDNAPDDEKVSLSVGTARAMEQEVLYTAYHYIDHEWNLRREIINDEVYRVVGALCSADYYHGPILGVRETSLKDVVHRIMLNIKWKYDDLLCRLFMLSCAVNDGNDDSNMRPKDRTTSQGLICTTSIDQVLHSVARCLLPVPDYMSDSISILECMDELTLTRHKRKELLSQLGLVEDPREYDELWYSCYCSLQVLLKEHPSWNDDYDTEVLCDLWGKIYRAIQRVSACDSNPTSNLCLEELFNVREAFQSQLDKGVTPDTIVDGVVKAKDVLDEAIKDSYLVWSIPLALDPRYKLQFISFLFKRAFGTEAADHYIAKVTAKIRDLYTSSYAEADCATGADDVGSATDPLRQAWDEHRRARSKTDLDRYLNDDPIPDPTEGSFDILKWWKVHGSDQYPTVARMARDALAMPTSSKLSSEQMGHIKSILRNYSTDPYRV